MEACCVYLAKSEKAKLYSYRIQPSRKISSSCFRLKPSSTPLSTNRAGLLAHRAACSTVESWKWQCKHLCRAELSSAWLTLLPGVLVITGFHYFRLGPGNTGCVSFPSVLSLFPRHGGTFVSKVFQQYHVVWHMGTVIIPPLSGETTRPDIR